MDSIIDKLIEKTTSPCKYVKCSSCSGTGKVKRHSYYAKQMPKETEMPCENCKGKGRFLIVPDNANIVRESEKHLI